MFELSSFNAFSDNASIILDAIGVAFIFGGAILATVTGIVYAFRAEELHAFYRSYRHNLARSIVTGLDFLVASDIISTVNNNFSVSQAISLSLIVIIRIVISLEFEMTLYGHWPWRRKK